MLERVRERNVRPFEKYFRETLGNYRVLYNFLGIGILLTRSFEMTRVPRAGGGGLWNSWHTERDTRGGGGERGGWEYAEGFKAGLKRLHDGARCGWRVVVGESMTFANRDEWRVEGRFVRGGVSWQPFRWLLVPGIDHFLPLIVFQNPSRSIRCLYLTEND